MNKEIDLRAIAKATKATQYRVMNGYVELFRLDNKSRQWQVGRIVNEQVTWSWWPNAYPPENTERL